MRSLCMVIALTLLAPWASAASFGQKLQEGNAKLKKGDIEGAMDIYRDLQIEEPESDVLAYNMGLAQYKSAKDLINRNAFGDASTALDEAAKDFQTALKGSSDRVREAARISLADTAVQAAYGAEAAQDYKNAVKGYEDAIHQYQDILSSEPHNMAVARNINHCRYRLKKLLQKPPPKQQQKQGGKGGKSDENKQGDKQQQQQNQPNGKNQKQDGQQQQSDQSGDQNKGQKQQEGEQKQQQAQSGQSDKNDKNKSQKENGEKKKYDIKEMKEAGKDKDKDKDKQNKPGEKGDQQLAKSTDKNGKAKAPKDLPPQDIDAILQSLENSDNHELHDIVNKQRGIHVNKDWW